MKRLLLFAMIALSASAMWADLNGNGYYRVQNAITKRYAYLLDDKGSFDPATTSADVNALELYSGFLRASSDPATVFDITKANGTGSDITYDVAAQGTSIHTFLKEWLRIEPRKKIDGVQAYLAYATKSGFTKYLGDIRSDGDNDKGFPSVDAKGDDRLWFIDPIVTNSNDAYFGIAPTLTSGGKYYQPFFSSFSYNAYSAGVKFYMVSRVDASLGVVVIKEMQGVIPAGTPCIVECSNPLATDNRLNVGPAGSLASTSGNMLKGVYFQNFSTSTHRNLTANNKKTMRVLRVIDGKLRFIVYDQEYLPRNESYLLLTDAAAQNVSAFDVVKEEEYDDYVKYVSSLNPDGYYRMVNTSTKRFVSLVDKTVPSGSSTDISFLSLYSDALRATSDPATVLKMSKVDGSVISRNLTAQTVSMRNLFGSPLQMTPAEVVDGQQAFFVSYGSGVSTKFLGDAKAAGDATVSMSTAAPEAARQWWLRPVDTSSNAFGITPSLTAGGRYFYPFYADFSYTPASDGMKFYKVTRIDPDLEVMVMTQLSGTIPAGVPVIVECGSPLASGNVLNVGAGGIAADVSGNLLSGVYFDSAAEHTPYDKQEMRSLAVVNGKLVAQPADMQYVPRNQAFIRLSDVELNNISRYSLVTEAEYSALLDDYASSVSAGYYRLQNAATADNLYLLDNRASITSATKADLDAFRFYSDILRGSSDPASVFLLSEGPATGSALNRDLVAQGTSFYKMTKHYVRIAPAEMVGGKNTYSFYIVRNNSRGYLADIDATKDGSALSIGSDAQSSKWHLNTVDADSDNDWFGVAPSVTAGGRYYHPFMAGFPISPASKGVKIFIVSKLDPTNKAAIITEAEGVIPAGTPVIVESESPLASESRLDVVYGGNQTNIGTNFLKAVWFDSDISGHVNRTAYDAESMRVLSATDGVLRFVKGDMAYVPRNQAYLGLDGMRQKQVQEYTVMTQAQYEDTFGAVDLITDATVVDVYSIDGTFVKGGIRKADVLQLGSGLYILRAGSASEKMLVK